MTELIVDVRERKLLSVLAEVATPTVVVKTASLSVGDVHFVVDGEPMLIVERKSLSDLWSSIKDGRYKEQTFRLSKAPLSSHHIVYLIEGDLERWSRLSSTGGALSAVYSAMFSLNYFQGFSVWRTMNVRESAVLMVRFADKLSRSANKFGKFHEKFVVQSKNYQDVVVNLEKKKNVTPQVAAHLMLRQIPGISGRTTEAILKKYGNLANLLYALKKDRSCLDGITFISLNQKERKISKTAIANLKTFLLYAGTSGDGP